jgi:nucleoside-diphosphate-sugar epimerase
MKTMAISGATSMLGSAIARIGLETGYRVLCIVRKSTGRLDNLPRSDGSKILYLNLNEYKNAALDEKADVFFHLAWDKTFGVSRDDADIQAENIRYTLDAVRLADKLGCRVFVGAGSQAEHGPVSEPLRSDTPADPQSGYGIAKYAAGKLSRLLCSQLGIRHNWIRIISTFGINDAPHFLIMHVINELNAGRSPELTRCEQVWDYLYCDDAARAFIAAGEKGTDGKIYPLGSGKPRKLSEYLEALRDIVRPDGVLRFGEKEYYPHQPMYLCADISELTKDTGWKPDFSFEEGIRKLIENI